MVSTRALETAYLYEFWTFLVLGVWGAFLGFFRGPKKNIPLDVSVQKISPLHVSVQNNNPLDVSVQKNTPLDVSVLGGLASESAAAAYLCDKLPFDW